MLKYPGRKCHYHLTGVVIRSRLAGGRAHYTAFIRSRKNRMQWFYTNDGQVQCVCKYNTTGSASIHGCTSHLDHASECSYSASAGAIYAILPPRSRYTLQLL